MNKNYTNKYFSVLGDSISTLFGYSEPCDAVFYDGFVRLDADVISLCDTWWGSVIDSLGGKLLVNNSISGSTVIKHPDYEIPSYACSDERTSSLHKGDVLPDVIMIFMGINDWGMGAVPHSDIADNEEDLAVFSLAYKSMLRKLQRNYPNAEIWCLTLPVSDCKRKGGFSFPYSYGGRHIEEYCVVIRSCANAFGCRVIEMYDDRTPHDTIDGFHPNREGMKTLAVSVLDSLN